MKPQIKAIYLAVKDMDRAVKFYEDIFAIKVSSKDKRMSLFEFGNITFILYDPKIDGGSILFGENVVPCIEVDNVKEMLSFVENKGCQIGISMKRIGNYLFFQAKDTEGNIIEFYQLDG